MFTDFSAAVLDDNGSLSCFADISVAVQATVDACFVSLKQNGAVVEVQQT